MRLKSVTLSNVKSFRDPVTVNFDESLNILVGPNGGGKSNLLDTINVVLRQFMLRSFVVEAGTDPTGRPFRQISEQQPFPNIQHALPKFNGNNGPQTVSITFRVGVEDLRAIETVNRMQPSLSQSLSGFRNSDSLRLAMGPYDLTHFAPPQDLTYIIQDYIFAPAISAAQTEYLRFLRFSELYVLLGSESGNISPAQLLYFSPFRGATSPEVFDANLSGANPSQMRRSYQAATSRQSTSLIQLASLQLGTKRRQMEAGAGNVGFDAKWASDPEVVSITKYLKKVGYSWSLASFDPMRNIYRIELAKGGISFSIAEASTGEQEMMNYLFALSALGLSRGVLIIDEAELHLHPKWQVLLLELLTEVSAVTNTQVILSTHSPSFITPTSVRNVIRVYRNPSRSSMVARLAGDEGTMRDMLHVVNSHNNERMFFADRVVLVEGIMDLLLLQALVSRTLDSEAEPEVTEILEVHGKDHFPRYRSFLQSFEVPTSIVADRDYALTVGNGAIKALFAPDWKKIDKRTLLDKHGIDRETLAEALQDALDAGNCESVRPIWDYIKGRRSELKSPLSVDEQKTLDDFISGQRANGVFILREGDIEDYVPDARRSVDGIIALTSEAAFEPWLKATAESKTTRELLDVVRAILGVTPKTEAAL